MTSTLLYVTPHRVRGAGLPNRPAALLEGLVRSRAFDRVVVVNRLRADRLVRSGAGGRLRRRGPWWWIERDLEGLTLVEHLWPFGQAESGALPAIARAMIAGGSGRDGDLVIWVADPKSAIVFETMESWAAGVPVIRVFDAYDAWDLSPLVRGNRRRDAVRRGYAVAARCADVVFANSPFMADRMRHGGANIVHLVTNGAPGVSESTELAGSLPHRLGFAYVGRVHERVAVPLLEALADEARPEPLRIIGPIEREPDGWRRLIARDNVVLEGSRPQVAAHRILAETRALIVPHVVDDYTRSQDAMKVWDALSIGTPVIATSIPPAASLPDYAVLLADNPDAVRAAAQRIIRGELAPFAAQRRALAAENSWDRRIEAIRREIDGLRESRKATG